MFMEMLDDAIIEEADQKRRTRETEHRRQVELERENDSRRQQEDRWLEVETQLWSEMLGSWEQLMSAIQSEKVSWERGLSTFAEAFSDRVTSCGEHRKRGSIDHRIIILVTVAQTNDLLNADYQQWVLDTFLQTKFDHLESLRLQHSAVARDLAMAEQELRLQPWWAILQKSSVKQDLSIFQAELSRCEKTIVNTEEEIQNLRARYAVSD